ncbi:hypothetical protein MBLNU230_g1702t1 [Neophaeotheca triangularis]
MDRSYQVRPKTSASSTGPQKPMPDSNVTPGLRGSPSIVGMVDWLHMLGYTTKDINALNVIHVAGTKGKGSTCAFTESFLRAHGARTGYPRKTGLYTSPHLLVPEERIRIDGRPLDRDLIAKYFFEMYEALPQLKAEYDPTKGVIDRGPRYLQLWALFAFHVFIREGVDAAILETHNGGEYDATNVVEKPLVTAITTLGMDHIDMLGPTIENIAWHKAGIYKPGAIALSTTQGAAPTAVLRKRAAEKGEVVAFVGEDDRLPQDALQLQVSVQRKNASLAVATAQAFLDATSSGMESNLTGEDIQSGVKQWLWPGRFQTIQDGSRTWYLDAAHNDMSVGLAAQWFAEATTTSHLDESPPAKVLIFSHINELRDTAALLENLASALKDHEAGITHVIFSTYDESSERRAPESGKSPELFHDVWSVIHPGTQVRDEPTIQGAIDLARELGSGGAGVQTLITGSQHLVGPSLRILQSERKEGE